MADNIVKVGVEVDTSSMDKATAALKRMRAAADKNAAAMKKVQGGWQDQAFGPVTNKNPFDEYGPKIDKATKAARGFRKAQEQLGASARTTKYQMALLSYQMNDVISGFAMGQSAMNILTQQTGQIIQALQMGTDGISGSLKRVGRAIAGAITPARLAIVGVTAVVAAGAAAWYTYESRVMSVTRALNAIGGRKGTSPIDVFTAARQAYGAPGSTASYGSQVSGAAMFAGAGIDKSLMANLLKSSETLSKGMNIGIEAAQKEVTAIISDPTKGLAAISKKYGTVSTALEDQVKALVSFGRTVEAQRLVTEELNKKIRDMADTSSYFTRLWERVTTKMGVGSIFDAVGRGLASALSPDLLTKYDRASIAARRSLEDPTDMGKLKTALETRAAWDKEEETRKKARDQAAAEEAKTKAANLAAAQGKIIISANAEAAARRAYTADAQLAAEIEKNRAAAINDTTRMATLEATNKRSLILATAAATRAMQDFARAARDEMAISGAMTESDRVRAQFGVESRRRREQTLSGGAPAAAAAASGLNPVFAGLIAKLEAKFPELRRTSGFRTHEHQKRLREKYGSGAALPGTSRHEIGVAADYSGSGLGGRRSEIIAEARRIGLTVLPSNHGALHVQGPRSMAGVGGADGARPLTINRGTDTPKTEAELLAFRLREVWAGAVATGDRALQSNIQTLKTNIKTFGDSERVIGEETKRTELYNMVREKGVTITDEVRNRIERLSVAHGQYAENLNRVQEAQKKSIAALDEMRSATSELISGPLKAIAAGKKPGEALKQVGMNIGGKLIDRGAGMFSEAMLGPMGKGGGGLFGSLLGKSMQTAMMDVNASIVNINGGLGGALGGAKGGAGGAIGSIVSGVFSGIYANGGVMSSRGNVPLRKYAGGGVARSPQVALFGEGSSPEAFVPLPDGRRIPVKLTQGRKAISAGAKGRAGQNISMGGISVNVDGNADEGALAKMEAKLMQAQARQMAELKRNFGGMSRSYQDDYL